MEQAKIKKCPYCAEEINDKAIKCKHCGSNLIKNNNNININPSCSLCGGEMEKKTEAKSSGVGCLLILISLLLMILGWSLIIFPTGPILFFISIALLIYGLVLGSRRRGLWACKACGHQLERRLKWYEH